MHELHELKDKLCKELEEYGRKGDLSAGSLDVIDKLAHSVKNLDKVIEKSEEEEYSGDDGYNSYRGRSYRGRSYARGQNARRDSMGRYSRADMADRLRSMAADATDEDTRMELERLADRMER